MDVAHLLRIGRQIVRNVLARERLDEVDVPPTGATGPSFARLLLAPERLAEEPEAPSRRRGEPSLARALFARERLAEEPEAPPRRREGLSLARVLFAPEALPEDPPAPRAPRRRWLRWLVVPESLDPPT